MHLKSSVLLWPICASSTTNLRGTGKNEGKGLCLNLRDAGKVIKTWEDVSFIRSGIKMQGNASISDTMEK